MAQQKAVGPDLTKYMDKKLVLKLNADRKVQGVLRGFDQFMNVVLEDTLDLSNGKQAESLGTTVIRGNSILMMESLEPVPITNYAPKTR